MSWLVVHRGVIVGVAELAEPPKYIAAAPHEPYWRLEFARVMVARELSPREEFTLQGPKLWKGCRLASTRRPHVTGTLDQVFHYPTAIFFTTQEPTETVPKPKALESMRRAPFRIVQNMRARHQAEWDVLVYGCGFTLEREDGVVERVDPVTVQFREGKYYIDGKEYALVPVHPPEVP